VRRILRRLFPLAVVGLPLAACALLLLPASPAAEERGAAFQRLVGGLGLGPAVDLSRCAAAFDPRVFAACSWQHEPVPGGSIFCSSHAGAVPGR